MSKKTYGTYSSVIISVIMLPSVIPVFGEVNLQTNSDTYQKGDKITFTGKVQPNSSGLVTIVIKDNNDEFVLLTQAITNENYSFEKTIEINDKFRVSGNYHATGFILNMTAGVSTNFGIYSDYYPVVESPVKYNSKRVNFVDPNKDPQYYLDRYYNEPKYKSWFDRNYPDITIEEAIEYSYIVKDKKNTVEQFMNNEILPEAEASSIVEPKKQSDDNSDTAQMVLAVGGLGILFGAVYGIKKR